MGTGVPLWTPMPDTLTRRLESGLPAPSVDKTLHPSRLSNARVQPIFDHQRPNQSPIPLLPRPRPAASAPPTNHA